jgi:regulatory protein
LQTALRYLGYRSRSEAEVRHYLHQRGYLPAAVESAVGRLRSLKYVNDEVFARDWALARAQGTGYGPRRIDQELRNKGISQSLIRDTLRETFDQVDEAGRAKQLLAKRFAGAALKESKTRNRAVAFLQRRGYSSKVIFDLLGYSIEED